MPMKYYEQIKNQEIPPMDTGNVPAFLVDIVISEDTEKPITSGLFRLEKGESLTYTYTYHEMKLIVDGTLIIEDETGQKKDRQGWRSVLLRQRHNRHIYYSRLWHWFLCWSTRGR